MCEEAKVARRKRQLLGGLNHIPQNENLWSRSKKAGLLIAVPITVFNLELAGWIEQPEPAVWITAPRANNLRLIAVVEAAAAAGTCIHLALLSFGSRLLGQMSMCWVPDAEIRTASAWISGCQRATSGPATEACHR